MFAMITLESLTYSYHFQHDRAERLELFNRIGWGNIVKRAFFNDKHFVLTDMGIIIIVDKDGHTLVTAYMADMTLLDWLYHGRVPSAMMKRLKYNKAQGWVIPHKKLEKMRLGA